MKTAVVVTAGRRRHRAGYIYGKLPPPHPLVTKLLVIFGPGDDAAIPIEKVRPAGQAIAQLELALETQKAAASPKAGGTDDSPRVERAALDV